MTRGRQRAVLRLAKPLRDAIAAGHPWVFDRALRPVPAGVAPGEIATLADEQGPIATVAVDPASPIRARILDLDPGATIDAAWAKDHARAAATARIADPMLASTDAWRVIHGENDFVPGLVVDVYAGVAVVVFDGPAMARLWRPLVDAVLDGIRDAGVALRGAWIRGARGEGDPGEGIGDVPDLVVIREGAARFEVDVRRGQKTGFFLDQRQNRALVAAHAAGVEVLNLFSYTGGFSVQAALAGAGHVTSVDLSAPAIEAARRNAARSGVADGAHDAVVADAFDFLADATARGRRWDLVIVDPPSFAPSEKARPRALRAYARLNEQALAVVAQGGLFASASCSSHVSEADLIAVLADAGRRAGRRLRLRHIVGAASDHPVLPAFPEGRYLTLLLADVT